MGGDQLITENLELWTSSIKVKKTQGRGSNKKEELYGIKKLRELILELAVRGKLVPQDPSDEPASELLKRISKEKEQQVKNKLIKKYKSPPITANQKKPFDLPGGWAWCSLISASILENGDRSKNYPNKSVLIDDGIPFVNAGHLQGGRIDKNTMTYISEDRFELLKAGKFSDGDILFCLRGSLGKSAIVEGFDKGAIASSLVIVRLIGGLNRWYIHNYFNSPFSYNQIKQYDNGTAQPNLSAADLGKFLVPVPPAKEQERISVKVDELMALCDQLEQQTEASLEAHKLLVDTLLSTLTDAHDAKELSDNWARLADHFDTLITTDYAVEQLKQTILQLAVMGKLVPQDPKDEPVSELLKRIADEREQLVKDKKTKKQRALLKVAEDEQSFELADEWKWVRFGEVAESRLGKMLDKAKNKGTPLPYLRNTNVQWHKFELDDIKLMQIEDDEIEELLLRKGDLLICEGGQPGRCAIWKNESEQMFFQKALHRARPLGGVLSEYLQCCLTIDAATNRLDKYFTGATIKHFVGAKLNNYVIPMPPVEEQLRIVIKVNELMAFCDQLKASISDAQVIQLNFADAVIEKVV